MINTITKVFGEYKIMFPKEAENFNVLNEQLRLNEDAASRRNFHGHVTASALVISPDKNVLVIFHKKLQKHLQPGGHIESLDRSLADTAKREVIEETGLQNIVLHPWCEENQMPILIDTHSIPENKNKNEDAHWHHDFMYVFLASNEMVVLDTSEVSDFSWEKIDIIKKESSAMARALHKIELMKKSFLI